MQSEFIHECEQAGLRVRAVPASHLPELKAELEGLRRDGVIGDGVQAYLSGFQLDGVTNEGMQTILVVATPAEIGQAVFHNGGARLTALIPPTYMEYGSVPAATEELLNQILGKYGYWAKRAHRLPAKMLAAYSGLAEYGRNNVCYVEGLGSFALLSTYMTDMPCGEDGWRQPRRMAQCATCLACADNCPTGAFLTGRAVIDAERCITLHNEADSSVPFPDWISLSAHNSLIGCMRCQAVCPKNQDALGLLAQPVEFDEEETAMLLRGAPLGELPEIMLSKMKAVNMDHYYEPLARNLQALYAAASGA